MQSTIVYVPTIEIIIINYVNLKKCSITVNSFTWKTND